MVLLCHAMTFIDFNLLLSLKIWWLPVSSLETQQAQIPRMTILQSFLFLLVDALSNRLSGGFFYFSQYLTQVIGHFGRAILGQVGGCWADCSDPCCCRNDGERLAVSAHPHLRPRWVMGVDYQVEDSELIPSNRPQNRCWITAVRFGNRVTRTPVICC